MGRRHLTTAITMLVLIGILVFGAVMGVNTLFAPLPGDEPAANPSPTCATKDVRKGQRIRARQVQVSVFNAGTRAGLADETLDALTRRGFKKGSTGNAPSDSNVRIVQVWSTARNDLSARLVALQFGRKTKVRFSDTDLGPGVDVVVGNEFRKLVKAKKAITVKRASSVCVPLTASSEASS